MLVPTLYRDCGVSVPPLAERNRGTPRKKMREVAFSSFVVFIMRIFPAFVSLELILRNYASLFGLFLLGSLFSDKQGAVVRQGNDGGLSKTHVCQKNCQKSGKELVANTGFSRDFSSPILDDSPYQRILSKNRFLWKSSGMRAHSQTPAFR